MEKEGHYGAASGVVKRAVHIKETLTSGDVIWAVFDTERLDTNDDFKKARLDAKTNSIECAITNPCIEYWFLFHYEGSDKAYGNCDEVKQQLRIHKSDYKKGKTASSHFSLEQIKIAASRAEKFCQNIIGVDKFSQTSSEVYKLANYLINMAEANGTI